ncbi:hypothetical protein GCM10011609_51320 [Lentzea pudingi]|uniref:Uncharacterized protein n=1 Tax=Lentzea pudingi TaxID=1789439 RepID=A0ABQ2IED3_9PSEU|nr:hypothetical protein [Lentzea pudingi]GGN05746.1 hypothetical protein GCM10011609_51320 [Lentzea pudingi]
MSTLYVEQPWTFLSLLARPHYRVEVFDERDAPVAVVRERTGPGLQRPLRHTGFSGWTAFDLDVVGPDGRPLMRIDRGFGRRSRVRVSTPQDQLIGTIETHGPWQQSLHDANGQQLCFFGDVARIQTGGRAKRNGSRVRRDVVQINPAVTEPLRSLATACAVAFDVVRGTGTSHTSSGGVDWPV